MDSSRIRLARKTAKMTQAELADRIEVNRATVSKYETGEIMPSVEMLGHISDALGCDIEYLLGYSENMRQTPEDKALVEAVKRGDARTVEKLMGLEQGTITSLEKNKPIIVNTTLDPEWQRANQINRNGAAPQEEMLEYSELFLQSIEKSRSCIAEMKERLEKITRCVATLNEEGLQRALEFVSDLAEIPKYRYPTDPNEDRE